MTDWDNNDLPEDKGVELLKQVINFKDPSWILAWLDTALKKEKDSSAIRGRRR